MTMNLSNETVLTVQTALDAAETLYQQRIDDLDAMRNDYKYLQETELIKIEEMKKYWRGQIQRNCDAKLEINNIIMGRQ